MAAAPIRQWRAAPRASSPEPGSVQLTSSGATGAERVSPALDYVERLRRLAANDAHLAEAGAGGAGVESGELDPKRWRSSVSPRLVAVGGAVPSYEAQADAAVSAGATAAEIIGVPAEVDPIVGLPCVVAVAPKLAMALGAELPLPVPLCLLSNGSG